MTVTCPCCGQSVPSGKLPVEALLDIPLSPQQRDIVRVMVERYPRTINRQKLFEYVYQLDPDGGPDDVHTISVRIYQIRKIIERHGWTIPRMRSFMHGYKLEPLP